MSVALNALHFLSFETEKNEFLTESFLKLLSADLEIITQTLVLLKVIMTKRQLIAGCSSPVFWDA